MIVNYAEGLCDTRSLNLYTYTDLLLKILRMCFSTTILLERRLSSRRFWVLRLRCVSVHPHYIVHS